MSPALTRRGLVQGGAVVLGAAVAGIPASARPTLPTAFDPAAFVDDLLAAGYRVSAYVGVPCGGLSVEPPSYIIRPPPGRGFGAAYTAVMSRWADAIGACPDHIERVVAYVFERHRVTCGEVGT